MKTDFSRQRFDARQHYHGVLMQQGRVQLDADWNEYVELQDRHWRAVSVDVAGRAVVPKETPAGFKIELTAGQLTIGPGRIYVHGLLAENHGQPTGAGDWEFDAVLSEPRGAAAVPYESQPYLPNAAAVSPLPTQGGPHLIYADVWQREVTNLQEPGLVEPALGVDTTTRLQTVWQVKVLPNLGSATTCQTPDDQIPAWRDMIRPSAGRLSTATVENSVSDTLCELPRSGGYLGLENSCFRVEVHSVDAGTGAATFKWSRDNRSMAAQITALPTLSQVVVDRVAFDSILRFKEGDWVEITDDWRELAGLTGEMRKIKVVEEASRTLTFHTSLPATAFPVNAQHRTDPARHTRLRKWDQNGDVHDSRERHLVDLSDGTGAGVIPVRTDGSSVVLEAGVQITFSLAAAGGRFRVGDYWVFAARAADASIERLDKAPPRGIHHHYARLALLTFPNPPADCRRLFPPLSAISAADVSFDNTVCDLAGVTTVQQALDALCRCGRGGCCTLIATPGGDLQALFNRIKKGEDAHVCLPVGTYTLAAPVVIAEKGHLKVTGSGLGTRILAPKSEVALQFKQCKSVTVAGLSAETGVTGFGREREHLNGTLSFLDCEAVTVEQAQLKCAHGGSRAASCLNISDLRPRLGDEARTHARVSGCDLEPGHLQVGLLLVNAGRASVEDNRIRCYDRPAGHIVSAANEDRAYLASLRRELMSHLQTGALRKAAAGQTITVARGPHTLQFTTDTALAPGWNAILAAHLPARVESAAELRTHVYRIADSVLRNGGRIGTSSEFADWFRELARRDVAVASQGVVVGGTVARDLRILNNTIERVLQGIHVGLSHAEPSRGTPDRAGTVAISGNTLRVLIPRKGVRGRHGVFAGNCDTLLVENNYLEVSRDRNETPMDGVRVHGYLGRLMIVRQNHLVNVSVGVRVTPLLRPGTEKQTNQWLVAYTMAPRSNPVVEAPASVRKVENLA